MVVPGKKENLADKVRRGEQRTAAASGLSQQQDAQEFLTYLLDQAHEELKRLPKLYPDVSAASDGGHACNLPSLVSVSPSTDTVPPDDHDRGSSLKWQLLRH